MPPTDFRDLANDILDHAKDCLGEDVTYKFKTGGSAKIRGIFDEAHIFVDPNTDQPISAQQPILGIKLKDLKRAPQKGDLVIVRKKTYRVIDSQEDGVAGSSLFLHEVC